MTAGSNGSDRFDPQRLADHLKDSFGLTASDHFAVGFSGGADSTALLVALSHMVGSNDSGRVVALHFNHRIHPAADDWQAHCQSLCDQLGIPMVAHQWQRGSGSTPSEAESREARFQWFQQVLGEDQVLCLAQHQDDQVETVLMNLMERRGLHRVAGIRPRRPLGFSDPRLVIRPLLGVSRSALQDFLRQQGVAWVEDPANRDTRQRRAWLRHEVLPGLRVLLSTLDEDVARSACLLQLAVVRLASDHRTELDSLLIPGSRRLFCLLPPLSIHQLAQRDHHRILSLLRSWIHSAALDSPGDAALRQFADRLRPGNGTPRLQWDRIVIQGYQDLLYLFEDRSAEPVKCPDWPVGPGECHLPDGLAVQCPATIHARSDSGKHHGNLYWRWRRGGERVRLPGRSQSTTLKKAWQQAGVPPWERQALPYLTDGSEVLWVHGIGWCGSMTCAPGPQPMFYRRTGEAPKSEKSSKRMAGLP